MPLNIPGTDLIIPTGDPLTTLVLAGINIAGIDPFSAITKNIPGLGGGVSHRVAVPGLSIPENLADKGIQGAGIHASSFRHFGERITAQARSISEPSWETEKELKLLGFGNTSIVTDLHAARIAVNSAASPADARNRNQRAVTAWSNAIAALETLKTDRVNFLAQSSGAAFLKTRYAQANKDLPWYVIERRFWNSMLNSTISEAAGKLGILSPVVPSSPDIQPGGLGTSGGHAPDSNIVQPTTLVPLPQGGFTVSQVGGHAPTTSIGAPIVNVTVAQPAQRPWWQDILIDLGISTGVSIIPPLFFPGVDSPDILPGDNSIFFEPPLVPVIDETDIPPWLLFPGSDKDKQVVTLEKIPDDLTLSSFLTKQNLVPLLLIALLVGAALLRRKK